MRKDRAPLLLILFACFVIVCAPQAVFGAQGAQQKPALSAMDDYSLALTLYQQREYDQSEKILQAILARDPGNAKASDLLEKIYQEKGYVSLNMPKKPRESDIFFGSTDPYKTGVVEVNKSKVKDYYIYAKAYYKQGEYIKAAAKFRQILAIDPTDKKANSYFLKSKKKALAQLKVGQQAPSGQTYAALKAAALLNEQEFESKVDEFIKSEEAKEQGIGTEYKMGPGDEIQVMVVGQGNMSGVFTVEEDGTIRLPVIKETVKVEGLTATQLAEKLEEVLSAYVKKPSVVVKITKYESKKFYVIGQIGKPNAYSMRKNYMRLIDCLYEAGLPMINKGAAPGRVKVIKPHAVYPIVQRVNALAVLMDGKYKDNIIIEPGDTIYVPWNVSSKISITVSDAMQPFSDALRPVYYIREIRDWNDDND